jgi:hypothetical protein
MPDVKISGLPNGTVVGTSTVPAVTDSTTHKTTVTQSVVAGMAANNVALADQSVAVGGANTAGTKLRVTGSATGGPSGVQQVVQADPIFAEDTTGAARVFTSNPSTATGASAYTTGQLVSYLAAAGAKGLNNTVTQCFGFFAQAGTWIGNTNYGFYSSLPFTGTTSPYVPTSYAFYAATTTPSYFAGRVGINTTTPGSALEVIPGSLATQGINCLINGAATQVIYAVMAQAAGAAASNTGVYVNVTSATSTNYGVRIINPPQNTSNWSIYSDSAAQSYFAGNIGIGVTTPTNQLHVSGSSIRIAQTSTQANSGAAGNVGEIRWDDTYLYVRISTGWRRVALGAAF